jgi:hypothetical protein
VLLIWIMPHADPQSMSLFAGSAFAQVSNNHPSVSFCLLTPPLSGGGKTTRNLGLDR